MQRASDTAKIGAARLTGAEAPPFADEDATFEELRNCCVRLIAYLWEEPDTFEGSEAGSVAVGGTSKRTLPGDAYLLAFALPNFSFRGATAYDMLHHEGIPVGKRDYLRPPDEIPSETGRPSLAPAVPRKTGRFPKPNGQQDRLGS